MLTHTPFLALLCSCALTWLQPAASAAETWIGDPDVIVAPDNPYLKLADLNVTRALAANKPDAAFWCVWGATAAESARRGDETLMNRALAETDALAVELKAKPSSHWNITILLESILLWRKSGAASPEKIAGWLASALPSVEHSYAENKKGLDGSPDAAWTTTAPNAMLQSASVLALAGKLYSNENYTTVASAIVRQARTHQLPGGAFSYIHDSGPAPVYYGFEITFLGRYYQLTQDPVAKQMLMEAARYAHDGLSGGQFDASSAPWWKHVWIAGGPCHAVEIVAGVSHDPVARALAEARLKLGQNYWFSYVAMYFWDPSIPTVPAGADETRLSENINGPLLRRGNWQVVMPFVPRNDTVIGAALGRSDGKFGFDNYLESAALPIFVKEGVGYRGRDTSLFMIPSNERGQHSSLVGDGWIASGTVFHPRRGVFGELEIPPAEGWRVAQLWFADGDGLAGWLEAGLDGPGKREKTAYVPRGVLNFGAPVEASVDVNQPHHYRSAGLQLAFFGDQIESISSRKTTETYEVSVMLKDTAKNAAYGFAATRQGKSAEVSRENSGGDLLIVRIQKADSKVLRLYFNPTSKPLSTRARDGGRLTRTGETLPVKAGADFTLQPFETVLLQTK